MFKLPHRNSGGFPSHTTLHNIQRLWRTADKQGFIFSWSPLTVYTESIHVLPWVSLPPNGHYWKHSTVAFNTQSTVVVQREQKNMPRFHFISTGRYRYNATQQQIKHDVTNISASSDKTISTQTDRLWLVASVSFLKAMLVYLCTAWKEIKKLICVAFLIPADFSIFSFHFVQLLAPHEFVEPQI